MEVLIVVFINIVFILFVYFIFSKRIAQLEKKRLPQEIEDEINNILTSFNSTADSNIDLLDDRISKLKPLVERAEKQRILLEGLIKKADALSSGKLKNNNKINNKSEKIAMLASTFKDVIETENAAKIYKNENIINDSNENNQKKTKAKKSARKKKTVDQKIKELLKKGKSEQYIASSLGITQEEVSLKIRFFND